MRKKDVGICTLKPCTRELSLDPNSPDPRSLETQREKSQHLDVTFLGPKFEPPY